MAEDSEPKLDGVASVVERQPQQQVQRNSGEGLSANILNVSQLTRNTNEEHLREIFGIFGRLKNVSVAIDKAVMLPKGYAYVEFENRQNAEEAQRCLNGGQLDGRHIKVDFILLPSVQASSNTRDDTGGRDETKRERRENRDQGTREERPRVERKDEKERSPRKDREMRRDRGDRGYRANVRRHSPDEYHGVSRGDRTRDRGRDRGGGGGGTARRFSPGRGGRYWQGKDDANNRSSNRPYYNSGPGRYRDEGGGDRRGRPSAGGRYPTSRRRSLSRSRSRGPPAPGRRRIVNQRRSPLERRRRSRSSSSSGSSSTSRSSSRSSSYSGGSTSRSSSSSRSRSS